MTTNVNADAIAEALIADAEAEISGARAEVSKSSSAGKMSRERLGRLKGTHAMLKRFVSEAEREDLAKREVAKLATINTASEAAREMRSRAAEIKKRNPNLDDADALAKAMDDNPELAQRYRSLRNAGKLGHETTPPPDSTLEKRRELHKSKGNPALRDFSGVLEEVRKEKPRASESEIWAEAHRRRPDLYSAAKRRTS